MKGGLGNQLFCYAAARRLALVNDAELVIDDITGFERDSRFHRKYALDRFHIPVRKATARERLEPFERYRRGLAKLSARVWPFDKRSYLEQKGNDFVPSLLTLRVQKTVYLDGWWQSEDYFKDVQEVIRRDLRIIPPQDANNRESSRKIKAEISVGVHVRWFERATQRNLEVGNNLKQDYYARAAKVIEDRITEPHYFVFSDDWVAASEMLALPKDRTTYVCHNQAETEAYADLWLMTQCNHFIIANSTFSWWGAWLAESAEKIVITPNVAHSGLSAWGFQGLVPNGWLIV